MVALPITNDGHNWRLTRFALGDKSNYETHRLYNQSLAAVHASVESGGACSADSSKGIHVVREMKEGVAKLPNGLVTHYYEWPGTGPTLLLLHPTCGYGRIWEWLVEALGDHFHIVAPDQRGHGYSGRPDGSYSAEEYADDAALFMKAVGIESAILFGHSLGSRVAQVLASRYPQHVQALMITAPHLSNFYGTREAAAEVLAHAASVLTHPEVFTDRGEAFDYMRTHTPWIADPDEALNHRLEYNFVHHGDGSVSPMYDVVRVAQGLSHLSDDYRGYAAAVECPVLILRAQSGKLTVDHAANLAALWRHATVVDVPGTYAIQLENPQATADAINAYLARTLAD